MLKVKRNQWNFVASNVASLGEAFATRESGHVALPFAIYEKTKLIGFVMIGFNGWESANEPAIAKNNYLLWRFMIAKEYQGKGYGRKAMQLVMDYVHSFPCGPATYMWISFEPENVVAKNLYKSFGFVENGQICDGETVVVTKL